MRYGANRCKSGYNAAITLAVGAKTAAERKTWERMAEVWMSRWRAVTS